MPIAKLKNIDIYYEIHGQGYPLILIAGYACDHTFWTPILDGLAKQYQVVIFDNRGIGQTKDQGIDFTIEKMADDVIKLMQFLKLEQPIIAGQSMGGAITQTIAIKYPKIISKIIIMNSSAKINLVTLLALQSILNLRKQNVSLELVIDTVMPWLFSSEYLENPENISIFKNAIVNNPYPPLVADQQRQLNALKLFDARKNIKDIRVPTLIVAGSNDIICSVAECQILANGIKNSTLTTIETGHATPLEKSKQLIDILLNFLNL